MRFGGQQTDSVRVWSVQNEFGKIVNKVVETWVDNRFVNIKRVGSKVEVNKGKRVERGNKVFDRNRFAKRSNRVREIGKAENRCEKKVNRGEEQADPKSLIL